MIRAGRHSAVQHTHELRKQFRLAAFENNVDLPPHIAFGIHGLGGGEHAVFGQLAAGAEPAVEFIEIGFRPTGKILLMMRDDVFDERVGRPIELTRRIAARWPEQIVHRYTQATSQFVERAGVWIRCAPNQAADSTFIELRSGHHILKREVYLGHDSS